MGHMCRRRGKIKERKESRKRWRISRKEELETCGTLPMGRKEWPPDELITLAVFPLKGLFAQCAG